MGEGVRGLGDGGGGDGGVEGGARPFFTTEGLFEPERQKVFCCTENKRGWKKCVNTPSI